MNEYRGLTRKQLRKQADAVLRGIKFNNDYGFPQDNPALFVQLEKISAAIESQPKTWWQLFKEGMAD